MKKIFALTLAASLAMAPAISAASPLSITQIPGYATDALWLARQIDQEDAQPSDLDAQSTQG